MKNVDMCVILDELLKYFVSNQGCDAMKVIIFVNARSSQHLTKMLFPVKQNFIEFI